MSDTTTPPPTPPTTTPPVASPSKNLKGQVKITDKNSPFFGRIFDVLEEDVEHVIAYIKVGEQDLVHLFAKAQTTPAENTAVVSTIASTTTT